MFADSESGVIFKKYQTLKDYNHRLSHITSLNEARRNPWKIPFQANNSALLSEHLYAITFHITVTLLLRVSSITRLHVFYIFPTPH
jgi:hypothetical protein